LQSKWPLPNAALTPGDIFYVAVEQLAHSGYTRTVRNVSNATKHQVYLAYGITDTHGYVIDHLIPLEIGGSNEVTNLWPQPKKEARIKDKLEETLHHLIISHRVDLAIAQQEVAANWVAAYDKYCGAAKEPEFTDTAPTIPKLASTPEARPKSAPQVKTQGPLVWVNTNTGVYHYPGTRWYGNTVAGRYISEEDAIAEGDRPAKTGNELEPGLTLVIHFGSRQGRRCRVRSGASSSSARVTDSRAVKKPPFEGNQHPEPKESCCFSRTWFRRSLPCGEFRLAHFGFIFGLRPPTRRLSRVHRLKTSNPVIGGSARLGARRPFVISRMQSLVPNGSLITAHFPMVMSNGATSISHPCAA
jgi:hypothetical protein